MKVKNEGPNIAQIENYLSSNYHGNGSYIDEKLLKYPRSQYLIAMKAFFHLLEEEDDDDEALAELKKLVPENEEIRFFQVVVKAMYEHIAGDDQVAITLFKQAINLNKDNKWLWLALHNYNGFGDYIEDDDVYGIDPDAFKNDPNNRLICLRYLDIALAIDPHFIPAIEEKTEKLYFKKEHQLLIDFLNSGTSPIDDGELMTYIGNAYLELGKNDEAIKACEYAIKTNFSPSELDPYYILGLALPDFTSKEKHYLEGLGKKNNGIDNRFLVGFYLENEKLEKSLDFLELVFPTKELTQSVDSLNQSEQVLIFKKVLLNFLTENYGEMNRLINHFDDSFTYFDLNTLKLLYQNYQNNDFSMQINEMMEELDNACFIWVENLNIIMDCVEKKLTKDQRDFKIDYLIN
jgi:tetratricopeptide (TPR) repeat protein